MDGDVSAPAAVRPTARGTLRVVHRRIAALVVALALVAAGCTGSGSAGTDAAASDGLATPEPTVSIEELSEPNNIVIMPTPIPDGPRPLVVATVMGETGVMAAIDGTAVAGVVAEIDRLNDEGGVGGRPVELQRYDTTSRAAVAERVAERFIDRPPDLIVVSCDTDFSAPVLELADANDLLTISPCGADVGYLTGGFGNRNFTLGAPATGEGEAIAGAAFRSYGSTAMLLRDVTSPEAREFCNGFERQFRSLGGTITYEDDFSYDTLEPVQDRLEQRDDRPAFVVVCSHVPGGLAGAPGIITMLRSIGFDMPVVGGATLDEPGWFSSVPTLGELLFISWASNFGNDPDARVNDLVRAVQQNGETTGAGVSTILGADAIDAWARAVEAADGGTVEEVAAALGRFRGEPFTTGELSFADGARMDLGRTYRILRVVDGQLDVLDTVATPD